MKKKTISIGFPMEYEDDEHVCHYGLFLRENEVKAVEEKLQELQRKDNIINELKEFIKEWQNDLEIQSESVEGLDLFEQHTQIVLDDIMTRFNELEGDNK